MLSQRDIRASYRKGRDDIAKDFYVPCFADSIRYDRAVGFFSSSIYLIAWEALSSFLSNRGRIRLICSPYLQEPDIEALARGYEERARAAFETASIDAIEAMLNDVHRSKPTQILAALVKLEILDLRVAFIESAQITAFSRLFHDKIGLFHDAHNNVVAFKGSMNESWMGLSNDGNLESIDVYVSWEHEREKQRVVDEEEYFEALWSNTYPGATVEPFPQIARERLISAAWQGDLETALREVLDQIAQAKQLAPDRRAGQQVPRPHQVEALTSWAKAGNRGIFEHATGSGKTFTAICAIRSQIESGKVPIVLVPSELLLSQWERELRKHLEEIHPHILVCGAGHTKWRDDELLGPWTREPTGIDSRIVLATIQTACRKDFLQRLRDGEHIFLVADEVHRLGSGVNRNALEISSGSRLGLSATPTRFGDADGTQVIFDYFGSILSPRFTLYDAISLGVLTQYFYFVRPVALTESEQAEWTKQSTDISVFFARNRELLPHRPDLRARLNILLIERARIAKAAANKIPAALQVINEDYKYGQHWLIYCDDQSQLTRVLSGLRNLGFRASEYHTGMSGNKDQTIRDFEVNGGILVSIRCLDEGVDIPAISHALIMASSKNPREFIQRRGRVLRRAPGKHFAYIYDLLTVPESLDEEDDASAIVAGELSRAVEFSRSATNSGSMTAIQRIAERYGLSIDRYLESGIEGDTDDQ